MVWQSTIILHVDGKCLENRSDFVVLLVICEDT